MSEMWMTWADFMKQAHQRPLPVAVLDDLEKLERMETMEAIIDTVGGNVFCCEDCAVNSYEDPLEQIAAPRFLRGEVALTTQSNPLVEALLEQATCDGCGFNLRDLARVAGESVMPRRARRRERMYYDGIEVIEPE